MSVTPMRYVYVLQSRRDPTRHYVGRTSDVAQSLATDNSGGSIHRRRSTWQLNALVTFRTEELAVKFEKFLKSGSGRGLASQFF